METFRKSHFAFILYFAAVVIHLFGVILIEEDADFESIFENVYPAIPLLLVSLYLSVKIIRYLTYIDTDGNKTEGFTFSFCFFFVIFTFLLLIAFFLGVFFDVGAVVFAIAYFLNMLILPLLDDDIFTY